MSVQVTASHRSPFNVRNKFNSHSSAPSTLCISPPDLLILLRKKPLKLTVGRPLQRRKTILPKSYLRLPFGASSSYQRCSPVCSFGGKGQPENGNEASPWKSLEKAMGNLKKEQSVEDALRQQIEKQEYYDEGGNGGNGLGDGDGGGKGRGRGSSPGGSGDEGFLDELLQTTLAILGIIFLYAYFIQGDNYWFILTRDYIKFLFGAKKSNRLQLAKIWWRKLCRKWIPNLVFKPYHLERDIVNTPTYWDDVPNKYYGFPGMEDITDSVKDSREYALDKPWYYSEDEYQESEKEDDDDDDEPSLSSGKGDESFLKSGEADEPNLASEEENEPDLTSNIANEADMDSRGIDESNLKSIGIDGSVLASGENGVPNLGSTESESDEEDEDYSDSTDIDEDYFYYTGKVKFTEADVDFATRVEFKEKRVIDLGRTKKVKRRVIVSRECEEDDEDEDISMEDDEESDYVGNEEEEDDGESDFVGNEEEDDKV